MRVLIAALVAALPAAPVAAADLRLDARTKFTIPMEVNGQVLRIRVDPAAPGYLVLNPSAVTRLNLKPSIIGSRTSVGPVVLKGHSRVVTLGVGGVLLKTRAVWLDRDAVEDADALISPEELPFETVSFALRPPTGVEKATELSLDYANSDGLTFPFRAGERRVQIRFTTADRYSMATASAAAQLASLFGSRWTGEGRGEPVRFGIVRPVRPMTLGAQLDLSGFTVRSFLVRTGDNRGNYNLPTDSTDPDEIVVTAKVKGRQPARMVLTVGEDGLAACSGLSYRKAERVLTIQCGRSGG